MTDNDIRHITEEIIAGSDVFLVDVAVRPENRIVVTVDCDAHITIDQCAHINRELARRLDESGMIFELEVTSSGLGQPLKILRQYRKYLGQEVAVVMRGGQKLTGILRAASEREITLELPSAKKNTPAETRTLLLEDIKSTKIVIKF